MKEFLQKLGIELSGRYDDDGKYVIDIENSDEYMRVYAKIENSTLVHEIEDDSVFDLSKNILNFEAENYNLKLEANLDDDTYSLTLTEKEDLWKTQT